MFTFNGTEYELDAQLGADLVATYRKNGMNDTIICGLLSGFKKQVDTVVKKSADTVFADVRSKVSVTKKDVLNDLVVAHKRAAELDKLISGMTNEVQGAAIQEAERQGLKDVRVWLDSEFKLQIGPAKKGGSGQGGSAQGAVKTRYVRFDWNGKHYDGDKPTVGAQLAKDGMPLEINGTEGDKKYTIALSAPTEGGTPYYSKWMDMLAAHGKLSNYEKYNKDDAPTA